MFIFSLYWTCEVITTVGYGDYSGGTTLEYQFTICLEFLGFVIFSSFQITAFMMVTIGNHYDNTLSEMDEQCLAWFAKMEKTQAYSLDSDRSLPRDLYKELNQTLYYAFRHDLKAMVTNHDFYFKLSPKM